MPDPVLPLSALHKSNDQLGFTYAAVICLVAILAILSLKAVELWHTAEQREREQQLLFVGEQYRSAIQMYVEQSPGTAKRYPAKLSDLLLDTRSTSTRRPLRRLYFDPITNSSNWGLIASGDGGIAGVYSLSMAKPVKQQGFTGVEASFNGASQYQAWRFAYPPQ